MKSIQEFLSEIAALDVKLWMDENSLRCNAPQGILTPEIRAKLSDHKDEIIKFLQDSHLRLIPRSPRNNEPLPLSWAQERLWFLNQLEGSTATYNIPAAVHITGNLDLNVLQQALSEIVRRHSILRTSFQTVNGTPRQVIHPSVTIKINVVDLQQLSITERETVQKQLALEEAITPFNLEIAPLIRCSLLQLSAKKYVLFLTMHHIVSDGWSTGVLVREVSTLYQASCAGAPSPLPELPIQYADFAVWQRQWLSGSILETQLNYWRDQLHDAPSLLQLPTDRPRPVVQTYQGRTQTFTLNRDLTQKLQSLSGKSSTTLFMTLYAAFATLLYRYSGQTDILVGSPIANRNHSEIESLIGFFVNTLVLRTSFEANPSFENLLKQVRETTLNAYEHQDVPFEKVVEALQPQRSLSHFPLFGVMFVLQNAPMGEVKLPGVTLTHLDGESTTAKFDLTLSMSETDRGLVGEWEYNTDLFDGETIERMAGHFQNLLSAIVENPVASVGEIPLLSEAERHQLLVEWNDTHSEYPQDKCIHSLFEEQVQKTPLSVAVVFENQQLTYLELNQRANQLAHHLQSLGVGPEVLVGICVERSVEMVVGLLGILKAGGAYVPLDPAYPQERLAYMLNDSQMPVVLTQTKLLDLLPDHDPVICLDTDWLLISSQRKSNPMSGVKSSNLAYVIYTSGSTGMPKGAMILHQGVVNYLSWCTRAYSVSEGTGAPVQSSIAFDATITSLFSPLLVGQKVVLLPQKQEIEALSAVLSSQSNFSLVKLTPAHLELLAQLLPAQIPAKPTNALVIGGEALLGKSLSFWHNYAPNTRLFNEYGPTETVVGCCVYEVTQRTSLSQAIPIGRPIANTQLYVLDQFGQPVPIGVPGELYIGGDGLALGYLNRPELTIEKFIPNPFSDAKSERLYKTGDLVRYNCNGDIEYLGRIDNQVKIRGFRIELGEIEAILNTHPQIQQAIVTAIGDIPGNKSLVAYVVPSNESLTTNQLRSFLKQKLPKYMVPSVFVTLDTLPLTPNGKIDKLALPTPDSVSQENEYIPPRTVIELQLTQIWSSVINIIPVGVRDNFFTLGGHSLLAVRLMSQIQQHFQINLPLATLFQSPTIEQLAHLLSSSTNSLPWSVLVPIKPNGNQPPLFCIHPAGGNVLCYQDLAYYLSSEQPFYGLQSVGLNPQNRPHTSIEQMATHYIKELQTVQPNGPYFLSGWSLGSLVAFEMAQQLCHQGEQIALLALLDSQIALLALLDSDPPCITSQKPEDDAALLVRLLREDLDLYLLEQLRQFELDEQLIYVVKQAKQKNLVPEDFDLAQAHHLLKIYKLNAQAAQNYKPQYYSGSIVLFQASETDADLESTWNEIVEHVETYIVPGNHQTMLQPPHVQTLVQKLQKYLEKAQTNQLEKSNAQTTQD